MITPAKKLPTAKPLLKPPAVVVREPVVLPVKKMPVERQPQFEKLSEREFRDRHEAFCADSLLAGSIVSDKLSDEAVGGLLEFFGALLKEALPETPWKVASGCSNAEPLDAALSRSVKRSGLWLSVYYSERDGAIRCSASQIGYLKTHTDTTERYGKFCERRVVVNYTGNAEGIVTGKPAPVKVPINLRKAQ